MSVQLTIFLLFFGGLQGILLGLFLLRKKIHHSGYIFLLLYFVVMLLQIAFNLMNKGWLIENWYLLHELSYHLPVLYGPAIYLFTRQLLQRQTFQWANLVHFSPFFILVFFFTVGYSNPESPLMLLPFLIGKFSLMVQIASLYLYHWLALQCWKNNTPHLNRVFGGNQLHWLQKFIYTSLFTCTTVAFLNYFMVALHLQLDFIRPAFLVLILFIYWISYEALYHPEIFRVIKGYAAERESATEQLPRLTVHRAPKSTGT